MWHRDAVRLRFSLPLGRMRGMGFHALVIGGYALLTVALTYPLALHLNTHIPSYPSDPGVGDPWFYMWAFGFIHRVVTESAHWSLFTDTIFYPRGVDLTLPLIFGVGLPLFVSIPFVHFLGIVLTYNLFAIGSFILNAYVTFLLVRYLTQSNRAALISGMIFAFVPYHMVRLLSHLNILASGMWIPLYIILFIRSIRDGRVIYIILTSFAFSLISISNLYYAFFLGLFSIFYALYNLRSESSSVIKNLLLKRLLSVCLITLLFFIPIMWAILVHSWEDFHVDIPRAISYQFGADLLAFFLPSSFHSFWGEFVKPIYYNHFTGGTSEQTVYLGYIVIALSLIAVIKIRSQEIRFWALSAAAFFVLALGAFLRIYGTPIGIPLPYWLFLAMPLVNTLRGASRSGIMVMMALSVLAGYGIMYLLKRLDGREGISLLILGVIMMVIAFEFVSIPLPLADARVPKVYQKIAAASRTGGTLVDVPLHVLITRYLYYQTTHGKQLLLGQVPRLSVELLNTYADSVALMRLFKNPELIQEYEENPIDKREILRFIEFFDLSFIVIHKDLLGAERFDQLGYFPRASTRMQAEEMLERLTRFFLAHFPVLHVEAEGDVVSLELARGEPSAEPLAGGAGYLVDFGGKVFQASLTEGWWPTEYEGETTFVWSTAKPSQLWMRFPRSEDFVMELRLRTLVDSPVQGVTVYANGQLLEEIELDTPAWQLYTVRVPKTALIPGPNNFRFVYRYGTSPAEVFPDNKDTRKIAVGFDFIRFRTEGEVVSLELAGGEPGADGAVGGAGYLVDFGGKVFQASLTGGWWPAEREGETTYAWSTAKASQLWVHLPRPEDFVMELRLRTLVGGPPEVITVYANDRVIGEVAIDTPAWQLYTVRVPKTALTPGLNNFRFVYRYGTSPAEVFPDNKDTRRIAVGFDFIRFRTE
jgi:hypothetical protein